MRNNCGFSIFTVVKARLNLEARSAAVPTRISSLRNTIELYKSLHDPSGVSFCSPISLAIS